MRIVDAQVHIWSSGKPTNANHRQVERFTKDDLLKEMDEAGVDGAVIHPPASWDPSSNELAVEAARQHPDRLAILDHGSILRSGTPAELIASLGIPSVVELTFAGAAPDPGAFASRLGSAVEARGDIWEIPTTDPKTLLPRLLSTIESERVEYQQVHVRRATLEDVFLQLTGRSLRE